MADDGIGLLRLMVALALVAFAVLSQAYAEDRGWLAKFLGSIAIFGSLIAISLAAWVFAEELGLITQSFLAETHMTSPTLTSEPTQIAPPTPTSTPRNVCAGVPPSNLREYPGAKHQVQRGETLSSIAAQYGISLDTLRDANKRIHPEVYGNPDCLRAGIWLIIPGLD